MKAPGLFKEYLWLVNTIYKAPKITLKEINEKWLQTEMSEGVEMARSTFNRHKSAIEEMFGINIECDRRNGYRYYISNAEVLDENSVQMWMMSIMSMGTIMKESFGLKERIIVENVNIADAFMLDIVHAMKQGVCLNIEYQKYGYTRSTTFTLAPYCIKMFRRRWYVLGRLSDKKFGIYALDRIKNTAKTDIKFKMDKDFDATQYFSESFGVMVSDEKKCENIVVRVIGQSQYYLRDLPLHHSQSELRRTKSYTDIAFNVKPTSDFIGELLSFGPYIKVLKPQWLADEMKRVLQLTVAMYD